MPRKTRASTQLKTSNITSTRSRRRQEEISYKEPASDEYSEEDDDGQSSYPEISSQSDYSPQRYSLRNRSKTPINSPFTPASKKPKQQRKPRSRASTSSVSQTFGGETELSPMHKAAAVIHSVPEAIGLEIKPQPQVPWTTLEYTILLDIFSYGTEMLENDKKRSSSWLIGAATCCKAFYEPALTALYRSPPLDTSEAIQGFLAATKHNAGFSTPVGNKVKYLEIEAFPALTRKEKSQDRVSLETILAATPNIRSLAVELYGDDPASKREVINSTARGRATVYKPEMMKTLEDNKTFLRSMKWNYFFNRDQEWPWCELAEVHQSRSMRTIGHLEIAWFNHFTKIANKTKHLQSLIAGINALPNLKSLTLRLCGLFCKDESLLAGLPPNLESLTIKDCDDLTSEDFTTFLSSHGRNLRHLTLNHNRSLNIAFMSCLATSCPSLKSLKIDMSFYGLMVTTTDPEPCFQYLLPEGSTPTWPSTMEHIEMLWIRKWERNAATVFFSSLIGAAKDLPNLRYLMIKTTVDLDWRDRVAFRDEWTARLYKVFKSCVAPPKLSESLKKESNGKITGSIRKIPINEDRKRKATEESGQESIAGRLGKRSRQEDPEEVANALTRINSGQDSHPAKSRRLNQSNLEAGTIPSDDSNLHIQGLCTVVHIRIENLRPMETQYAEV